MTRNELAEPASAVRATSVLPAMPAAPAISAVPAISAAPPISAVPAGSPDPGEIDPDREVVDLLLWRDAQHLLGRHSEPDPDGKCAWCGWRWPCPPRRLGERAEVVARRPRLPTRAPEGLPAEVRHDVAAWRSEIDLQADDLAATEDPPNELRIRGVVRLPRQHRSDPPAPA